LHWYAGVAIGITTIEDVIEELMGREILVSTEFVFPERRPWF
jgi:CBS domain containing-hemolysin-like protein